MLQPLARISIPNNLHVYVKDPNSTELGIKILKGSIELISLLGFEKFTFKKLAIHIETTEASIYRYFESKHKIMYYFINWYWGCVSFKIYTETQNLNNAEDRLKKCIHILTAFPNPEQDFVLDNEMALKEIVMNESAKVFQTKNVDDENKKGVFTEYKKVVEHVSSIILEINPAYPYPNMLVSTMIEGSNQQRFFAAHLPRLTNVNPHEEFIETFFMDLINKTINK